MTRNEFNQGMALLVGAVGRAMPDEQVKAWFVMFSDLTAEQFHAGIVETVRTHEFHGFPPVAVIRKNALGGVVTASDRAGMAWSVVKAAVARHGGYATVAFDDPLVTAVIRMLGGWVRVCDTEPGEQFDTWLRRDFERSYESLMRGGVDGCMTGPLSGLIDMANSATGFEDRLPVQLVPVGLPDHSRRLVRGETPQPTRIGSEVRRLAVAMSTGSVNQVPVVRESTPKADQVETLKKMQALKTGGKP